MLQIYNAIINDAMDTTVISKRAVHALPWLHIRLFNTIVLLKCAVFFLKISSERINLMILYCAIKNLHRIWN